MEAVFTVDITIKQGKRVNFRINRGIKSFSEFKLNFKK